jgi:hypothetical protein
MAHMWSYTIDPAEPVVEELTKPAPAEESANIELTEGKPGASHLYSLTFVLNQNFVLQLFVHYVYRNCIGTIDALGIPSRLPLLPLL